MRVVFLLAYSMGFSGDRRAGSKKMRKPVQQLTEKKLWEELEAQHILLGFKEMFKDAKINLYRAPDNGGNVKLTETYGAEEGAIELNILHWNTLRHFDGLILK
jgi:hypothetical protein